MVAKKALKNAATQNINAHVSYSFLGKTNLE